MAIRIRNINGFTVALCAARTKAEPGDIYLDDTVHHALSTKFARDWESEGLGTGCLADSRVELIIDGVEGKGGAWRPVQDKEGDKPTGKLCYFCGAALVCDNCGADFVCRSCAILDKKGE